ncbi:MAG: anthranilate phosphoribosyltransferase [Candidatus Hadarchaeum sp.]|uniref:anthranilate phosphoribosyltransferase n=1 Tax=Candidatus Hadarchaeum sp. TaxID=2883567 RepID=UPI003D0CB18D
MIREAIEKLVNGEDLTRHEAFESMMEIMSGSATPAQIAAFLTALRMKSETVEEITSFAMAMRCFCQRARPRTCGHLVDTCGTGGDRIKTFNVSTAAAFVIAGAGVPVAKHGNRSVTSKSGSADVLECLGLNLNVSHGVVWKAVEQIGIGFLFAPLFHPAMKYAAGPRKEMGIRTVFNLLGPLTNPALPDAQVIGVCSNDLVERIALVLRELGLKEAMVVHGLDGLDEISIIGKTRIAWLREGEIKIFTITPKQLGVKKAAAEDVSGASPMENAETVFRILHGCLRDGDPKRNLVTINAAAGIIVGGKADDFAGGLELANESIESGAAYRKLKELVKLYNRNYLGRLEELEKKYS